jgi:two-component system NtrC family sensor kinase
MADVFARFFDALQEGVYIGIVGDATSATEVANPHLRLMFGWSEDLPVAGITPFDRERFVDEQARRGFLSQLRRDGSTLGYLLRLRRVDGSAMWVEVTARATVVGAPASRAAASRAAASAHPGAVAGLRIEAVLRDVSERKKLQDQARDLDHELSQAEKLAALGQTMSGVAHELNNPLATILACAERLAGRPLEDHTKRDLDAIHNAADRAARIVRNLQTFARKRHTTRTLVDLNHVVRETLALRAYEQRAGNIVILQALAAGLPAVFADPHQIQQVLLNLVLNAEQAMLGAHGRGTLILRSWHDAEREAVVLEVSDDGPGVPDTVQPRIFDPFFTTKAVGKGTGLGLTVAYAIAQEHGGRIGIAQVPGRGATFLFELPVGGKQLKMPEARPTSPLPVVPRGTRALVIEDERALGEAVADALRDEGFDVDRAADGQDALANLHQRHYDVIICDLKMPTVDGMTFFSHVSEQMPQLARRIVFVTGDVAAADTERFLEESGCRWLPKPFRLKELVRVARETLT